jgi:hypothetical protein
LPLAVAGLWYYLGSRNGRRFRSLGWIYVAPFILFLVAQGRGYYLAPAYSVLYAGGSVWFERILRQRRRGLSRPVWALGWITLSANTIIAGAFMLPIAPINSPWWHRMVENNSDFAEQIGWPELVETIAGIRDALPSRDRTQLGILAGNYGEAGAINLYGPRYGLPPAISGINSYWQRGYGDPPPETLIVVGFSREFVAHHFHSFELAAHSWNCYGVANEETTRHPDIFVCRRLRQNWHDFWKNFQRFG